MSAMKNVLAMLCGVVIAVTAQSAPLQAQTVTRVPAPEFLPMQGHQVSLDNAEPILVQTTLTLKAGEQRRVFGQATVANSTSNNVLAVAQVLCYGPNGFESEVGDTNQNHQGKNTPIGTSYPYIGQLALQPSLLLTASYAGNYTCSLRANSGGDGLSVVARDYDNFSVTWLQVSSQNDGPAGWWQNLPCDEYGDTAPTPGSSCIYLAGATNQQDAYIFENDGSKATVWKAPWDAAFIDANDSLLLTTCDYGTNSCTSDNTEGWWNYLTDNPGGTTVQSHMELLQLYPDGKTVCNINSSPDQTSNVGDAPHHYMIYHSILDAPVYPCDGSRLFRTRIYVKYISGNPVKIDGSGIGAGKSTFTHAYAVMSASSPNGAAPPIPDVLGLNQEQADDSIKASGYLPASVSYSLSTAPAGTVISQNPTGGVINYPGTGVNITLSTGGATIPNLISLPETNALNDIRGLGLVPSVSFSKECINPGDVLTQSPQAGTVVSPGSTVYITIDSGTRQTCIIK